MWSHLKVISFKLKIISIYFCLRIVIICFHLKQLLKFVCKNETAQLQTGYKLMGDSGSANLDIK